MRKILLALALLLWAAPSFGQVPPVGAIAIGQTTISKGTATYCLTVDANGKLGQTASCASGGTLLFANGTAMAPSISFLSDTSTGLYRIGASKIGMTLGGTRFGAFDSSGNFVFGAGSIPSGGAITSGTGNFLALSRAGGQLTSASNYIIMGLDAGLFVTTGATGQNPNVPGVYIGFSTGKNSIGGGNTGVGNLSIGGNALGQTDVYAETGLGENSLSRVTASQKDTGIGSFSLASLIRGGQMTGVGRATFNWVSEGSYSFAAGHSACGFNVAVTESICVGDNSGYGGNSGTPPRITASQSTTTLTVTAFTGGDSPLVAGMVCVSTIAAALPGNITIVSGPGGTGGYTVTPSQTVASQTMQCGFANSGNIYLGQSNGTKGFADSNNIIIANNVTPASASHITVIGGGQTAAYTSGYFGKTSVPTAISNAAGVTLTAAQMLGGPITRSSAVAVSDTTPTAAQFVAAMPGCEVGAAYPVVIVNNDTGLLTLVAGDVHVTLAGTTTILTVNTRVYELRATNCTSGSEAVTLSGLFAAAN